MRPAAPGFLFALCATALLAVVTFSVPWLKPIYLLKATLAEGTVTLGTMGYCVNAEGVTRCSGRSIGYDGPLEADTVSVWMTYALVSNIVAFGLCGLTLFVILLTCMHDGFMIWLAVAISSAASLVSLIGFAFNLAFVLTTRSSLNGAVVFGNALWLSLAAWILITACAAVFVIARTCFTRKPRRGEWEPAAAGGAPESTTRSVAMASPETVHKHELMPSGSSPSPPDSYHYQPTQRTNFAGRQSVPAAALYPQQPYYEAPQLQPNYGNTTAYHDQAEFAPNYTHAPQGFPSEQQPTWVTQPSTHLVTQHVAGEPALAEHHQSTRADLSWYSQWPDNERRQTYDASRDSRGTELDVSEARGYSAGQPVPPVPSIQPNYGGHR